MFSALTLPQSLSVPTLSPVPQYQILGQVKVTQDKSGATVVGVVDGKLFELRQQLCSGPGRTGPEGIRGETMELGSCGWRLGHATSSLATIISSVTRHTLKSIAGERSTVSS